jgi:sporulation protein YlmC with PRC-barrel domain
MKYSKIDGMKVYSSDSFYVGDVIAAEINIQKWEITHFQIELSDDIIKRLGYKKPLLGRISICIPVGYIKTVGDVITIDRTLKELEKLPEC